MHNGGHKTKEDSTYTQYNDKTALLQNITHKNINLKLPARQKNKP